MFTSRTCKRARLPGWLVATHGPNVATALPATRSTTSTASPSGTWAVAYSVVPRIRYAGPEDSSTVSRTISGAGCFSETIVSVTAMARPLHRHGGIDQDAVPIRVRRKRGLELLVR